MASYVVLCTMLLAVMANAQAPAPQPTQKLDVEGQKLNLITDNVGKLSQTSGYTLFFRYDQMQALRKCRRYAHLGLKSHVMLPHDIATRPEIGSGSICCSYPPQGFAMGPMNLDL